MRVHELAKELGKPSKELLAELQELGFAVTAATSGLSDDEAAAIRSAYAALGPEGGSTATPAGAGGDVSASVLGDPDPDASRAGRSRAGGSAGKDAAAGEEEAKMPLVVIPTPIDRGQASRGQVGGGEYVLVRKGTVSAGDVVVRKGHTISASQHRGLPRRVQAYFDHVK